VVHQLIKSAGSFSQTPQVRKAVNSGAVSICPAGLQSIPAHQIESDKLEALIGVAHMRTQNLTEDIGLAATSRARARAAEHFELQK
jgi:hypothetical protein